MASPLSRGTWDLDPVHSSVRFRVIVPVGGFVSGRFDELRGRATVDEDGAIHAEDAATAASAGNGVSDRDRHPRSPGFRGVTADPQIDVTAQRQAADGNVSLRPSQKSTSDRFSTPEPEQENLR